MSNNMNNSIDKMEKDRNWSISILNYIRDLSKSRYDLDTSDVYNDAISQINNCYDFLSFSIKST